MSAINTTLLEQELTAYFAGKLNMTVDTGIFRGGLPELVAHGVSVRINGQDGFGFLEQPVCIVQLLGKFATREEALDFLDKMRPLAPKWGEETEHFTLVDILPVYTENSPFEAADRGLRKWCASFPMRISVLTKSA